MEKGKSFAELHPNRGITPFLKSFLEEYPVDIGNALDIGCGLGQDSKYLAEQGFDVDALDKDINGLALARTKNRHKKINFVQDNIQTYVFTKRYNLILAFLSLFFMEKGKMKEIFERIAQQLDDNGYALISLIGPNDDRASSPKISTRDKEELKDYFKENFPIEMIDIQEEEVDKNIAGNTCKKRWHIIKIVLKKNK